VLLLISLELYITRPFILAVSVGSYPRAGHRKVKSCMSSCAAQTEKVVQEDVN
jgi:hypothetical protein